ncbi:MAG: phosphotransferase [Methylophilus sp.]|nr:phosphotransferase [Methylophilus sp.]
MDALRAKVFIVGESDLSESDFIKLFGLVYCKVDLSQSLSNLEFSQASSIVFDLSSGKLSVLLTKISQLVIPSLNHGLRVIALCKITDLDGINLSLSREGLNHRITILVNADDYKLNLDKHLLHALHNQTLSYNSDCQIVSNDSKPLDAEVELLLKRAFSDFKEIHLKPLRPGFSARNVFCIHVTSHILDVGRSTPFFAKVDEREKILKEMTNYKDHVLSAIPFNLRPNVDDRRSILGAKVGLLVGNFVENSDSLWSALKNGQGRSVIYSLFDQALYAWRYPLNANASNSPIFNISPLKSDDFDRLITRYERAKSLDDNVLEPGKLVEALNELPYMNFSKIRMHGDLHTENVFSRNGEAILIDFASVDYGAPSMDPAALEVSIAFRRWPSEFEEFEEWRKVVDQLYTFPNFKMSIPKLAHDPLRWAAVWNSIRQIRSISFAHSDDDRLEYLGCLAYRLFKAAKYPSETELDDDVLAYAYLLTSQITKHLKTLK